MTNGWRLTGLLSVLLGAMCLAFLIPHGWDIEGLRLVVRSTARTSLVLFAFAFSASALYFLAPNAATRWQRRNRRYLGVSFAVSHALHLAALIVLIRLDPALFWTLTNPFNIAFSSVAYLAIALMTVTSFDTTAAWLGPRKWQALHRFGGWYILLIFAGGTGKRLMEGPIYWAMFSFVLAIAAVRLIAMSRRGRRTAAAAGAS